MAKATEEVELQRRAHRRRTEKLVALEAKSPMPTRFGEFTAYA